MTKLTTRVSSSTRLTDTQLIVLSRAAQREDGAAAVSEGMTEKAAQKLAASLIERELVREIRARPGMPVWRRSGEGRFDALIITKLGRAAIKIEDDRLSEDNELGAPAAASTDKPALAQSERSNPRQGSKLSIVIDLLDRKKGAGIEELITATGWLPHTTRAALTGLRKRGYAIERERSGRAARSTGSSQAPHPIWRSDAMRDARSRQPVAAPAAQMLEAELDRIAKLGLDEVRVLWRKMTQQNAPKALSRDLLARMIAYRVQEQQLGKLCREMRKLLDRLAKGGAEPVRHLKVGTVMVRAHQGTLHEVMVVPGGFSWQDKTYPSLSTIAQAITGTSWNGPRFFGLRGGSGPEAAVEPVPVMKDRLRVLSRSSIRSSGHASRAARSRPSPARRPRLQSAAPTRPEADRGTSAGRARHGGRYRATGDRGWACPSTVSWSVREPLRSKTLCASPRRPCPGLCRRASLATLLLQGRRCRLGSSPLSRL